MSKIMEGGSSGRRAFLGRMAAGAAAGAGVLGLAGAVLASPPVLDASPARGPGADPEHWLDNLKGKHRQLVDAYAPNEGFPLAFAHNFLVTQPAGQSAGAVLVLRHFAFPIALGHEVWGKYKIGESLKIVDPATKAPAVRNPFYRPPSGVLLFDDLAVDRLVQHEVIIGACSLALTVLSGLLSGNAGVSKEAAYAEWKAAILPGVTLIPSGVWGVNRAQEKGCTYCAGG